MIPTPLIITAPDPAAVTVLNPEVLGGRGVVVAPPGTKIDHFDVPLAQCGRTFVHRRHETTEGWCAGLDGTEVPPPAGLLSRLRARLTHDRTVC